MWNKIYKILYNNPFFGQFEKKITINKNFLLSKVNYSKVAQFIDPYGSYFQGKKLAKNPKHLGAMANFHISILIKKICPREKLSIFKNMFTYEK